MSKTAFVMMPSGNHGEYEGKSDESDFIYNDIVRPALIQVLGETVNIIRETDNRNPGAITRELIRHIAIADICVVDVTGLNPNVFFELGIRYALRRSITILLRQSKVVLPFDITDYRCVEYSSLYRGPQKAIQDIAATISTALARTRGSDSLVFNVLPDLHVEIPGVVDIDYKPTSTMPWPAYWRQFETVVNKLDAVVKDGIFIPQAVLGISNGGLIYADLLGRHLFQSIPVLSLWADRHNKDANFFDNPVNDGVILSIKSRETKAETKIVLLVDDIVASGTTLKQATKYLETKIPDWKVYFLPLFSRNEKYLDIIRDHLVWFAPAFRGQLTEEQIKEIHAAEMPMLPYKKEIRST